MSSHQHLPATNSMSLAEARESGLLDLWHCRRANKNNVKGFKNRHRHHSAVGHETLSDSAKPKILQGQVVTLILPWSPSINHYWERSHDGGMHIGKAGKRYIARIAELVMANRLAGLIGDAAVSVALVLSPPDTKLIYDADNYHKALFDSLTKAGVWVDDSQIKQIFTVLGDPVKHGSIEMAVRLHASRSYSAAQLLELIA
jgi:crossover junction endodeoxyribonuclease RusA